MWSINDLQRARQSGDPKLVAEANRLTDEMRETIRQIAATADSFAHAYQEQISGLFAEWNKTVKSLAAGNAEWNRIAVGIREACQQATRGYAASLAEISTLPEVRARQIPSK